jgi:hypothetical protein
MKLKELIKTLSGVDKINEALELSTYNIPDVIKFIKAYWSGKSKDDFVKNLKAHNLGFYKNKKGEINVDNDYKIFITDGTTPIDKSIDIFVKNDPRSKHFPFYKLVPGNLEKFKSDFSIWEKNGKKDKISKIVNTKEDIKKEIKKAESEKTDSKKVIVKVKKQEEKPKINLSDNEKALLKKENTNSLSAAEKSREKIKQLKNK